MGNLQQGKDMAADYFLKLEQLAFMADVDIQSLTHVIMQLKRNVNPILIDQLYQSADAPQNHLDYKRRIITMDEMH
jgi:hypothetical protein